MRLAPVLALLLVAPPALAAPAGVVSSANLDFGQVALGDSLDLSVVVRSTGDGPLTGYIQEGCEHFAVVAGGGAYTLAPGDSLTATVRFRPTVAGIFGCVLTTSSCQCSNATLSGEGVGGEEPVAVCDVSPTSLDFGTVVPDSSVYKLFRIKNAGGGTLTGNVSEACAAYSIVAGGGDYALAEAESVNVLVRFLGPGTDGDYPCSIETGGAVLKALAACSDVAATGTVRTPQAACTITPSSLDFGILEAAEADTLAFVVKNTGDVGSTLSGSVSESCAAYTIVSGGGDFNLAAGESVAVSVGFVSGSTGSFPCTIETGIGTCADVGCTAVVSAPSGSELMPEDLAYLGAFKFGGGMLNEGGGRGMDVLPNGDLIICGTDDQWGNVVIATPATPSLSGSLGSLPTATTVQSITDITEGVLGSGDPLVWRWEDIVVMDDRVVILKYPWYDRNYNNAPALAFTGLSYTGANGPHQVGPVIAPGTENSTSIWYQGKIAGYGDVVPPAYVEGGRTLAIGRVRYEYGPDISAGPAVYLVNPEAPGSDVVVALCYDQAGAGLNDPGPHSRPDYSLTNQVTDMAWIGETLLFAESYCPYPSHYGQPPGDMGACVEQNAGYVCGNEGDPLPAYNVQISFYRAADLMAVVHGSLDHWVPQPYALLNIYDEMIDPACQFSLGGMCYDETTGRLYVMQRGADTNNRPVCHVWQVTP